MTTENPDTEKQTADKQATNQGHDTHLPPPSSDGLPPPQELMKTASQATPVMAQWFALKKQEEEALLFFRMGDFYELFFHDAQVAATALDISLTNRGHHDGRPIPMCGVPVGAAQAYLSRLIRRGFRVAVAEQTETPKKGQKGPLNRAIIRVVTPGTLTEDELLEAGRANILLALAEPKNSRRTPWGAAWIDISTGSVDVLSLPLKYTEKAMAELFSRLEPSEILASPTALAALDIAPDYMARLTPVQKSKTPAEHILAEAYKVAQLKSLGDYQPEQLEACALLLHYVRRSQAGRMPHLVAPMVQGLDDIMGLDPDTRQSLDILQSRDGGTEHTVFNSINNTRTAAGMRLLAQWLSAPLTDQAAIINRQTAWQWLLENNDFTAKLGHILRHTPDCARALGRISSGRPLPRDLAAIRDTLRSAEQITTILQPLATSGNGTPIPKRIAQIGAILYGRADVLYERLVSALSPELPARLEDGGVIAPGFDSELDHLRELRDNSRRVIAQLQARLAEHYGIATLRIRHHNQLGYVIEIPGTAGARLRQNPEQHPELHLRQGTTTLARFSSDELAELDKTIMEASEKANALERHFFLDLCQHIQNTAALDEISTALAECDVLASCALLMSKGTWCCPDVTQGQDFDLVACRHPIVEAALLKGGKQSFIPNDCALPPDKHVMLLTGPNMAGKSTFLRQNALAVILAQAGLPVPAHSARIGLVDRLFSRVGAADDLARGRSTFMVEMTETASILNQAGPRSLVVVDEIGRGTATLDGLSIAWATLESLHSHLGVRTIFATHFHELGALLPQLPKLAPYTMAVKEWEGNVIFQHEVKPGLAGKSWGLHVARLAGLPRPVLTRAKEILNALEETQSLLPQLVKAGILGKAEGASLPLFSDTTLSFDAAETVPQSPHTDKIEEQQAGAELLHALERLDPDALSPREAQSTLYHLKEIYMKNLL